MSTNKEVWRKIGYDLDSRYEVSNIGRVRSTNYKNTGETKILSLSIEHGGYRHVRLCNVDGKRRTYQVHRLVAMAFIPNPDNKPCINHLDEDPSNNCVENLEWCTYGENNVYNDLHIRRAKTRCTTVVAYDNLGNEVGRYRSACHAAEVVAGAKKSGRLIIEACKGKRNKAYGFHWKYAE